MAFVLLTACWALHLANPRISLTQTRVSPLYCTSDADGSATDGNAKRREADRLALLAEQASLEAEQLELEALALRGTAPEEVNLAVAPTESAPAPDEVMALQAPLRWLGPYPAIALSLPQLSSPSQKQRQLLGDAAAAGVTLDFVIDTAASTNTISAQVAGPTSQGGLELDQVGSVPAGVGAGGAIGGGLTYSLGICELGDVPKAERVTLMSGLTATALPVAAPAAAGLLGAPFLKSFGGGVDFAWGPAPSADTEVAPAAPSPPGTITFYGDAGGTEALRADRVRVPIEMLEGTGLPSICISIGGVSMTALLDTGSPVTVLNAAAARAAGVEYDESLARVYAVEESGGGVNPFARLASGFKSAQAAARGDVLTIGGANGPVSLARAKRTVEVRLLGTESEAGPGFEGCLPYVGELPGLAALDGLGAAAGPAAVLGVDVLRKSSRMWFTPSAIFLE